jgi:UDPglucose 6-dehydrogenase
MKRFTRVYLVLFCYLVIFSGGKTHTTETNTKLQITILGSGYVGLVSGAGLAELGHRVICADVDSQKIQKLNNGIIPIYEQGLEELIAKVKANGNLSFTDSVKEAIHESDILFIAVGTPMSDDGQADMRYVNSVVAAIGAELQQHPKAHKVIITKSTVPVGTGASIQQILINDFHIESTQFSVVSNPEFLREGTAVEDFLSPDRIIVGCSDDDASYVMHAIYAPLIERGIPLVVTNLETSELIKYASNTFLALKLTFMNEIANYCDIVDADASIVAHGMGLDHRINPYFLRCGPGYGGSCFPKDAQALLYMTNQKTVSIETIKAVLIANEYQKRVAYKKIKALLAMSNATDSLVGTTVAVLGLAFKANTDDVRDSSSIALIKQLLADGVQVRAYDPVAMNNMAAVLPEVQYCNSALHAAQNADVIVIMTEWKEFGSLDFAALGNVMHKKILIDARNIVPLPALENAGFIFDTIGRSYLCKRQ